MEQFYNDLADIMRKKRYYLALEDSDAIDYIDEHDLLIFQETLSFESCDDCHVDLFKGLSRKKHKVVLDFYNSRSILGNVVVNLGDKWFAFGRCMRDPEHGEIVTEIWSLRYVLSHLSKMEIASRAD